MNKSILKTLVLVPGILLMAACQPARDAESKSPSEVPTTLSFSKPTPGAKLSREQLNQIQNAFAAKPAMILPPGELIFKPKEVTAEQQLIKEQELKRQDQNSYDLLKQIQSGCTKDRPTFHMEATFPIDGDEAKNNLRAGDYVNYSASAGLAGSVCPVEASASSDFGIRVEDRNKSDDSGKASASSNSSVKALIKDVRYANLLGSRGLIVQSSLSGLAVIREVSKDQPSGRAMIEFTLGGSYLSLTQDIPFSMSMKILSHSSGTTESVSNVVIQMKDFSFHLITYATQSKSQTVQETYLNGYPLTQEELKGLFGKSGPDQIANQTAAFLK